MEGVDERSAVTPIGLVKKCNGNHSRTRRWYHVLGVAPPSKLGVFNNNLENGYKAFAERYFMCKVGVEFEPALPSSDWLLDEHMVEFLERVCSNLELSPVATTAEVVDAYKGPKRKLYEQAESTYWTDGVTKMHAMLRSFVKFEKCDLSKAPRVINPRHPTYNLALGQYLKLNEHQYFKALADTYKQRSVVIKGMDAMETADVLGELWNGYSDPVGVGGDASKFDMHVSREALYYEHLFYILPYVKTVSAARSLYDRVIQEARYTMSYQTDEENLCWLLSQQLDNTGTAYFDDGKLKFSMRGTRASGDLNTSLGNCLLMCALTYTWSRRTGVSMSLANNGDDCVYIMERSSDDKWRDGVVEYFADKGFRMVLEDTVDEFSQVEFCQSNPINTFEGMKMVRKPSTLVTKASMCLLPINNLKGLRRWMMAVGVAEGSLNRGVPVLQSFANAYRRNGLRCSQALISRAYYGTTRGYHMDRVVRQDPVTDEARLSFYVAWGVPPHEQVLLEEYYDSWQVGKELGRVVQSEDVLDRVGVPHAVEPCLLLPDI